jgi:uncharacterized protein (DUF302 family)
MNVIYEKTTEKNLNAAIESLEDNLKKNGFGVLWQLNFKEKLEEKGLEFKDDFVVLEVCNPKQAKEVMDKEIHIGYVLPCKMVVRRENNKTYIGMTSPETLIGLYDNTELKEIASEVEKTLRNSIESSI